MIPTHRSRSKLLGGLALLALLALPVGAGAADVNPCAAKTLNPCAAKTLNPRAARTLNPRAARTLNWCQAKQPRLP